MSTARLVDTNVLLVAEGEHGKVSAECHRRCVQRLAELKRQGPLVLDDGFRILNEYGHQLARNVRQPGLGRAFYKWALRHQYQADHCTRVAITALADSADGHDFAEFPDHPGLAEFDRSDRKFVATAVAHGAPHPPIVQAADSKWIGWAPALEAVGVAVEFLCHDELKDTFERKMG